MSGAAEGPPWVAKRKMSVLHGPLVPRPEGVSLPSSIYGNQGRRLEDTLAGLRLAPAPRESVVVRAKPKVTSPQILEQHISKIISENAAIVETLDPLWSKRYTRRANSRRASEGQLGEGSIIRDLLLRREGCAEGACPRCGIWFRSGATLEVHLEHYCKAPNPPPKKRKVSEPVLSRTAAAAAAAAASVDVPITATPAVAPVPSMPAVPTLAPPVLTVVPPTPTVEPPVPPVPPLLSVTPVLENVPPRRPTTLSLNACTLVGSTLVSPETPRPKKQCLQLYINGHAYTYLGLKCSTRSTYCCIYRPQPMYVASHPGLSMYSDWRLVPAPDPLPGVSHQQLLSLYDSRQWLHGPARATTSPCGATAPLVTHSSYWLFRSQKGPEAATEDTSGPSTEPTTSSSVAAMDTADLKPIQADPVQVEPPQQPKPSLPDPEPMSPRAEDGEEEGDDGEEEEDPRRVRIFEGGFKSNEAYTYVRGRGRGKYVCEECGIRCKKPSMLKKHIRTHTDLRPFSCHHCCFAFKTKGNLTKHMKSKAHHKKCTELGILPVPTTVDDSTQVDADTLARQEQQQRERPTSEEDEEDDDDEEEDDEDDEEEDDDEDEEEEEEEEEDDEGEEDSGTFTGMLAAPLPGRAAPEEQEAAHSLLHLSDCEAVPPLPSSGGCGGSSQRPRSFSMDLQERYPVAGEPCRRYSMSSVGRDEGPMDLSTARQRRLEILPGGIVSGQHVRSYARNPCVSMGSGGDGEEGRCGICHKSFARASQLRMHVNIHYFERPFRCEACAVSFRTRGHLQKHRRSVSHYNRLNMNLTFGTPTAENPRPFKCGDCKIAFRIHGHLAKHLRSKMHILKLECLGKLPFGMYAEMERSGVNLNEIDTSDCDNSLESLQVLAQKLYQGGEVPESVVVAKGEESCWENGALRPCPLCGRLLKSAKSLQVHLHCDHQDTLEASWPCTVCQRHFPSQVLLQQHFLSHTQPRPYVCDRCDAGFTSAQLLAHHVASTHPAESSLPALSGDHR